MSLPPNYKQMALGSPGPSHMMSPGMHMNSSPLTFNILKERLRPSGSMDRKDVSSPFAHSSHGNPSFTPQKLGKVSSSFESRAPKPPKAPEKPLMPFYKYSKKVWDTVKNDNPDLKLWEVSHLIAQQWREVPEEEKQEYVNEYDAEMAEYEKQLRTYHNSPTYVAYLSVKSKSKADEVHEPQDRRKQQERRIDIQPAEDEDDMDDGFSVKHVAYARYLRNHRLINEIFSDAVVPDVRSVVTTQRMHVLKRQVQSLAMHQMKLQAELQQIEEKFDAKKRKFVESSEIFQEELKRHCKPAVDEDKFKQMVERQYDLLKRERMKVPEEQKSTQPTAGPAPRAEESAPQPATATSAPAEDPNAPEPMEVDKLEKPTEVTKMEPAPKPEEPKPDTEPPAPEKSPTKVEQPKAAVPTSPPVSIPPPTSAPTELHTTPPVTISTTPQLTTTPPVSHAPTPINQAPPPHPNYPPNYNYPYPAGGYPPYGGHPPPPQPPHQGYQNYPPTGPYYHGQQYGPAPGGQPPYQRGPPPPPMHYPPAEMGHPPPPQLHYGPYPAGPMQGPPPPQAQAQGPLPPQPAAPTAAPAAAPAPPAETAEKPAAEEAKPATPAEPEKKEGE